MRTKRKHPESCIMLEGVWYVYTACMVETHYGPEMEIRLSRDGDWFDGPSIELSECMSAEALARLAASILEDEDDSEVH